MKSVKELPRESLEMLVEAGRWQENFRESTARDLYAKTLRKERNYWKKKLPVDSSRNITRADINGTARINALAHLENLMIGLTEFFSRRVMESS